MVATVSWFLPITAHGLPENATARDGAHCSGTAGPLASKSLDGLLNQRW